MPTYDYECAACGHAFELFQSMSESTKRKCPECKRMKLQRLIGTGGAILFKGSGFYTTDYRSSSYKSDAKADKPAGDSGGAKPAGDSGGAKPAAGKADKPGPAAD